MKDSLKFADPRLVHYLEHMVKLIALIIFGILLGLVIGYAVFAEIGGEYIPLNALLVAGPEENPDTIREAIESLGESLRQTFLDIQTTRRQIVISGVAGGLVGGLLFFLFRPKKKNKQRRS